MLSVETDTQPGEQLIHLVMKNGRRVRPSTSLDEVRKHAAKNLAQLPEPLRRLEPDAQYPVEIGAALFQLTEEVVNQLAELEEAAK